MDDELHTTSEGLRMTIRPQFLAADYLALQAAVAEIPEVTVYVQTEEPFQDICIRGDKVKEKDVEDAIAAAGLTAICRVIAEKFKDRELKQKVDIITILPPIA